MTNREYLIKHMSLYDMLMMLNANLANTGYCIMSVIIDDTEATLDRCVRFGKTGDCTSCVQAFLNEEVSK